MADLEKIISSQIERWVSDFNAKDLRQATLVCHPDCYQMPPGQKTVIGREAIEAAVNEFRSTEGWDKLKRTSTEVEQFCPTVCMSYSTYNWYKVDGSMGGTVKSLIVWKKLDGEWLAYRVSFNTP